MKYTVELCTHVGNYANVVVDADSPEEAITNAYQVDQEGSWGAPTWSIDYDTESARRVNGVWESDCAYKGKSVEIPKKYAGASLAITEREREMLTVALAAMGITGVSRGAGYDPAEIMALEIKLRP